MRLPNLLTIALLLILPTMALGQYQTIDESVLHQRVDDLTEVVNTHSEQIQQIADRVTALESPPVAVAKSTTPVEVKSTTPVEVNTPKAVSFGSAGTGLAKPIKPASSYGSLGSSVTTTVSYGSTGSVSAPVYYPQPAQVYSPPVQAVSRTRTVQRSAPVTTSRLGSRLLNFRQPGNCPGGVCPR